MSNINRAPFNALVDDDGSGLTGTVWNKARIKDVILDPGDVAWGHGMSLLMSAHGADNNAAYHNMHTVALSGLTEDDTLLFVYQFQSTASAPVTVQFVKNDDLLQMDLTIAANDVHMGQIRIRQGAMQPNIAASLRTAMINPSNVRYDGASWVSTSAPWTGPWAFVINCAGVPNGALYYSYALYRLVGQ